jgi:ribosomal protein S18 acetylase RimI-like enzyme
VDPVNSIGRIPNLAVVEAARGYGLGRRLIHHALDSFRAQGLKVAKIETMASNVVGQSLYPSCGFEEIGRQVHFAMRL